MTDPTTNEDATRALLRYLREHAEKLKGRVRIARTADSVGILNWLVEIDVRGSNVELMLESRATNLHEAADQMQIMVEAIL